MQNLLSQLSVLAADPAAWAALLTLIAMEVVLGIDNLIFIAILTNKLPPEQQPRARTIGIGLALILRLARAGLRTGVIQSTTYEEAPARLVAWIKQRTRWFKGYLQTWAVHMRHPLALWRELGTGGFLVFQLVVGGAVLAALVHGVFLGVLIGQLASGLFWSAKTGMFDLVFASVYVTTLTTGYALSALLGFIGLSRRRLLSSAGYLVLLPFYWLLLSVAAWRAVFQLMRQPYRWEKTAHGLARTSRRVSG